DAACVSMPQAADQMRWIAGDHGFELLLSPDLPFTLAAGVREAVVPFLAQNGRAISDVRHWIIHPGGPKILDVVQDALRLPVNRLQWPRDVLRRFGNMSSATVFFILDEMRAAGLTGSTLALAFGPGLTIEMVLLDLR